MRLPNGYGSVYKLGGKRRKPFAVVLTTGWSNEGKTIRKYLGYYKTKPEALKALAGNNDNPYDLAAHSITYAELFEKWCKVCYLDNDKKVPNCYMAAYKRSENLHDMIFAEIRKRHVQGEIDRCELSFSTKKNIIIP